MCTDLLVMENVEQWGVALSTNKTIETLEWKGVEADVVKKLEDFTKERTPQLTIKKW